MVNSPAGIKPQQLRDFRVKKISSIYSQFLLLEGEIEYLPNTISESVPKVKDAFLPTGKVNSSMSSSPSDVGSTNGSFSMEDTLAIGNGLKSFALYSVKFQAPGELLSWDPCTE